MLYRGEKYVKRAVFSEYPYPLGGNMQKQGVYLGYMPLFAFVATQKFSK